ncbi:MAG: hypothetical protein QM768_18690 [Agriterribacter sp.]
MKKGLFFLCILFGQTAFSQGDAKFERYVNWHSMQIDKHSQTDKELTNLSKNFNRKYPSGISDAQFKKLIARVKDAEDYYRPRAFFNNVFQESVYQGLGFFTPVGFKGTLIKTGIAIAKKHFDINKLEEKRIDERKIEIKKIVAQRLSSVDPTKINETIDQLKNEPEGKFITEHFGKNVFEEAKSEYDKSSKSALKPINHADCIKELDQIVKENNDYLAAQNQTLATILKAEDVNGKAVVFLKSKIEENNARLIKLKLKIDQLKKKNLNYDKELEQFENLNLQNALNIEALKVATKETYAGSYSIQKDISKIKDDVADIKLKQEWESLSIEERISKLKTSHKFDKYFDNVTDKNNTIETYEAVLFRQKVVQTFNDISAYGGVAVNAMKTFDIGSPQLQRGIYYIAKGASIVSSIYSHDYAAALNNALSLFGGGVSQQDQILMQIQSQISALEENMNYQFDALHEHLDMMQKNIHIRFDVIQQQLLDIGNQLYRMDYANENNFAYIKEQLSYIENQNRYSHKLLQDNFKHFSSCDAFVSPSTMPLNLKNIKMNFKTYKGCIKGLYDQLSNAITNNPVFDNNDYDNPYQLNELYKQALALFDDDAQRNGLIKLDGGLQYLLYLSKDISSYDSLFRLYYNNNEEFNTPNFINDLLLYNGFISNRSFKDAGAICTFINYTLQCLPYLELYDGSDQLVENYFHISEGQIDFIVKRIKEQIKLCELSIVQNQILDGYPFLARVGDIINDKSSVRNVATLFTLLKINPIFQKNLSSYFLKKYFPDTNRLQDLLNLAKGKGPNFISFNDTTNSWLTIYIDEKGNSYFNIQSPNPFYHDDTKTSSIENVLIALPAEEYELTMDNILINQNTQELFIVRNKLYQTLVEYDLFKTFPFKSSKKIDQQDLFFLSEK